MIVSDNDTELTSMTMLPGRRKKAESTVVRVLHVRRVALERHGINLDLPQQWVPAWLSKGSSVRPVFISDNALVPAEPLFR